MTLAFAVAPSKPSFVRGEPVYLVLTLTNTGTQAVELAVPVIAGTCMYRLTPPEGKDVWEEGPADLSPPTSDVPAPSGTGSEEDDIDIQEPPPRRDVQPGEHWSGAVELDKAFVIADAGAYRIAARIRWEGLELEAAAQEFKLEDPQLLHVSRGADVAAVGGQASLLLLPPLGADRALVIHNVTMGQQPFDDAPRIGSPLELRKLPGNAADPVASSSVAGLDVTWNFWREENRLSGIRGAAKWARSLVMPGRIERLIDPALLDQGRRTHVYAVCAEGGVRKLVVAEFLDYLELEGPPERILAEIPLQASPLGSDAFIDTVNNQPRRVIALGRIDGKAPRIDWMSYVGPSLPTSLRSHVWTKAAAAPAPDSRPAIAGLMEGAVRIAWFVLDAGRPTGGLLCEATFDGAGTLKSESTTPVAASSPISAARIVYVAGVPYVALWTEDGTVLAGKGGELQAVVEKSLRRVPPTFFVLRARPFVLDFDPVKGMILVGV